MFLSYYWCRWGDSHSQETTFEVVMSALHHNGIIGAEEEIRTPKKRRFKRSMSAVASPRRIWSPLTDMHRPFPVYETGASLSKLSGHSIARPPIIVKSKSVPAPFSLLGSPQQDWGSGSLPPRVVLIWSGRVDLNHRFLPSEGRGSTRLSYALVMERDAGSAPATPVWKTSMLLLHQSRIILYVGTI